MIEWVNAFASVATLTASATLIGVMVHLSNQWKAALKAQAEARDAKHESELAEKDQTIKQLQAGTYDAAHESETKLRSLVEFRDSDLKKLREELDKTQLEEKEKAQLLERMELQFKSEQHVLEAALDIGSKNPSTRLQAARKLQKMRDPRTIPRLIQIMSEDIRPTPTKVTVMRALAEFGEAAVPSLIEDLREHARLVSELSGLPDDPQFELWRATVIESDAGILLVRIGSASIPSLQQLQRNEGLLGEAAAALLSAIEIRLSVSKIPVGNHLPTVGT